MSLTGYNENSTTISNAFSSGIYRHVALSISGTIHTLYLDGQVVATNTNAGNIFSIYTSEIQNLYIGCAGDLSYGFTGLIDDFKIFNRTLPLADISAIYIANKPFYFYENFSTYVDNSVSGTNYHYNGGIETRYFNDYTPATSFTFSTQISNWSYNADISAAAVDIFYRNNGESGYFFNGRDSQLTDVNAWSLYLQCNGDTTSSKISTPLIIPSSGKYTVSFAIMQTFTGNPQDFYLVYNNIKVSLGTSYIIFNNSNVPYDTSGNISLSAYSYDTSTSTYTTPSNLMQDNPAISDMKVIFTIDNWDKGYLAFVTLTFQNIPAGTNILAFEAITGGYGFLVSQIKVTG